ncbi:hypothetical protein C1I98_09600 [Spongiactinospora gelatinilytica]|uniref:Uncharacterized protein n=1 Tax=Spongiactinospora gelatinilytica TaxID=2666298 RepID=A0A2W2HMM1_9ACTN|nr:hypothetical protein [Spongiactinospora gelatinilytica]PZG50968.1 hypothetical protein C1I98_09600 [Spongiactinospora gelatinilytica]
MNDWPELAGIRDGIPQPPAASDMVRAVLLASALARGYDGDPGERAPECGEVPPGARPCAGERSGEPADERIGGKNGERIGDGSRDRPRREGPALRRAWRLLVMEARLLSTAVLLSSFLAVAGCVAVALVRVELTEVLLGLAVPLVTGFGVAGLHSPDRDPAFELVRATPTSPRVILLARVTCLFGFDLAVALLGSALLTVMGAAPQGLCGLVLAWLGPAALLAALSLLLSVWWRADGAIAVALVVWSLPMLARTGLPVPPVFGRVWENVPVTLGLAALFAATAVLLAGRIEPLRVPGATRSS